MSSQATIAEPTVKVTVTVHPPVAGGKWSLTIFPRREDDVVIYFTPGSGQGKPELPRRVTWEVLGLQEDQTLEIARKSTHINNRIAWPVKLTDKDMKKDSDKATAGPDPRPLKDTWMYDVILLHASGVELARIDPKVVIIEDP